MLPKLSVDNGKLSLLVITVRVITVSIEYGCISERGQEKWDFHDDLQPGLRQCIRLGLGKVLNLTC